MFFLIKFLKSCKVLFENNHTIYTENLRVCLKNVFNYLNFLRMTFHCN